MDMSCQLSLVLEDEFVWWERDRDARVLASRKAGNHHLDRFPMGVESMRGKKIRYVHDASETGEIYTVTNDGRIWVRWSGGSYAGSVACITTHDAKDYVVTNPSYNYDPVSYHKANRKWLKEMRG